MSWMFEVYYRGPVDPLRESQISAVAHRNQGVLDFHEPSDSGPVVLTFEFATQALAEKAADDIRALGEHVEGPGPYGDD